MRDNPKRSYCSRDCSSKGSVKTKDDYDCMENKVGVKFWSKVNKAPGLGPNGDCWEWVGTMNTRFGYGQFFYRGSNWRVNRLSWTLYNNTTIPDGLHVCHSCDNTKCVNPNHLWLGTHQDNMNDKIQKGRSKNYAHLTKKDADLVRKSFRESKQPLAVLARQFNVSKGVISGILNNKTHKDIELLEIVPYRKPARPIPDMPLFKIDEFRDNINYHIEDFTKCWEWLGAYGNGEATFSILGSNYMPYRVSYYLYYKIQPTNFECIRHLCNNRKCVHPLHLAGGTFQDNADDRKKCGKTPRKITYDVYTTILNMLGMGMSKSVICKELKLSLSSINNSLKHPPMSQTPQN